MSGSKFDSLLILDYETRDILKQITLFVFGVILVGCSSIPRRVETPNNGWLKVEAGAFSIYAPPGWEFHRKQGIDSYVGEFTGSGVVLEFDYGLYSSPLDEAVEPKYVVAHDTIGGYGAKVVCPRTPGHGVTGVYFPKIASSNKLCLWGQDLTDTQQELALKIFRTVRFGPEKLPSIIPPPAKNR
jgi:hypothetical protein